MAVLSRFTAMLTWSMSRDRLPLPQTRYLKCQSDITLIRYKKSPVCMSIGNSYCRKTGVLVRTGDFNNRTVNWLLLREGFDIRKGPFHLTSTTVNALYANGTATKWTATCKYLCVITYCIKSKILKPYIYEAPHTNDRLTCVTYGFNHTHALLNNNKKLKY